MSGAVNVTRSHTAAILVLLLAAAASYLLMPSCANLVDADDALCHALADAKSGIVDWPEQVYWYMDEQGACHIFDHIMASPWRFDEDVRRYIEGFGLAQGHNWGELGRADALTYNPITFEVDTPLARTYNGYANLVYANPEGIGLDRGRSLDDFEYYDTFLKWMSAYVSQKTFRVNGTCNRDCENVHSNHCTIARTVDGIARNDYINLYQSFFYEIDSVWRASTIVHEVRHARHGVWHDGGGACPRGSACDYGWSSAGANTYEQIWLAAYYFAPERHPFISDARRERAKALFHYGSVNSFAKSSWWTLDKLADVNENPEFYVRQAACSDDPRQPHHCLVLAN